jgi:hypothetical protein
MNIKNLIVAVCFFLGGALLANFFGGNNREPASSSEQEVALSPKIGDVDLVIIPQEPSHTLGQVPQTVKEKPIQTTSDEEAVESKEETASHISANDAYSSPADDLANALERMRVIPDIHKKFDSDPVNEEWSAATEETFYNFFSSEEALNAGIMIDSIECRSTMCQSKLVNIDSNRDTANPDPMMRLFYKSEWGRNFIAQTKAPDPETGSMDIYFIKSPAN